MKWFIGKAAACLREHHRKLTFEQEFVALLKKHGVDYDPKFVFG